MNGRSISLPALVALICALFIFTAFRSPWWFLGAAAALLLGLRLARRNVQAASGPCHLPLGAATVLSLVLYAALASVMLLTVRSALGWLDRPTPPFEQLPLPAYMQSSSLGFYDKSELRMVLLEMLAFTAILTLVFVQSAEYCVLRRRKPLSLHPASAAFAPILFFASVYLPPYEIDLDHWFPFVAAATGIRNGVWPYFSGFDSSYGLLSPAFLAVWLSWFGLSTLSLSAVIMASNLVAGMASFMLMRRLTGSRPVALLGTAYLLLGAADTTQAVTSTFRAPVQITLGALLLYASLRDGKRWLWADFLFGVTVLWNPPFGAFAAAGFVFAHSYPMLYCPTRGRVAHFKSLLAMLAGVVLPLGIIWMFTASAVSSLSGLYATQSSGSSLVLLGYENLAQYLDPVVIPAFLLAVLFLTLVLHRSSRSMRLTRRLLFIGATLISAIPYVIYATARSDTTHFYVAYWALMPGMVLLFYGFIRLLSQRQDVLPKIGISMQRQMSTTVVFVVFLVLFPARELTHLVGGYTTGYEISRQRWYNDCAAGKVCDSDKKPTLRNYMKEASRPLESKLLSIDRGLAAACKNDLAILSYRDAWIYAGGDCYTPIRVPTVNMVKTRDEIDAYVRLLAGQRQVLFDPDKHTEYSRWRGDMLGEIKAQLIKQGFVETPGCGRFSVLSKHDAAPLAQKLCD